MADVFISYRHAHPDEEYAQALQVYLQDRGVSVFLDRDIPLGANWESEIGSHLEAARFFAVLLSENAITSDAIREEVVRAHAQMKAGYTKILPLRLPNLPELPYHLAFMLNPIQYVHWGPDAMKRVHGAITAGDDLPEAGTEVPAMLSVGGLAPSLVEGAPLPSADLRFLAMETGAVPLDSAFYVERALQKEIEDEFALRKGRTIVIRGPRQSGKSTQLLRAHASALRNGDRSWLFSFQEIDENSFQTLDLLLRNLALRLQLAFETTLKVTDIWNQALGSKTSFSLFVENAVLRANPNVITILCFDEVDLVFPRPYRSDFFKILRVWHNDRARTNSPWRNLTMVLAHATDPSHWIDGQENSPFNVAHLRAHTVPFTKAETLDLIGRYGISATIADSLLSLTGGQPYLVRQALYTLKKRNLSWDTLESLATCQDSPFADHLRGLRVLLDSDAELAKATREVLNGRPCSEAAYEKLAMAGLIEGDHRRVAKIRCELYRRYLQEHLS